MIQSKKINDQIELLFRQTYTVLIAVVVVATALAVSFSAVTDDTLVSYWLGSIYALSVLRLVLLRVFNKRNRSETSNLRWAYTGAVLSLISGSQWAIGAYIFFTPGEDLLNALLTVLLLGMVSGSIASLSAFPLAHIGYSVPPLLTLTYLFLGAGKNEYTIMGILAFTFLLISLNFSRNIYRTIITSIDLRHENLELVEKLADERDRAKDADQAKSKFLAAASHDLRQPLQAISLLTESLHNNLEKPENRNISVKISKSVQGLRELFDGLLDVSKLDAGAIIANYSHFDFETLVVDLVKEFKPLTDDKNISLINNTQPHIVRSDPLLVKRIMQNLTSNAVKYTSTGGEVVISTEVENTNVIVSIKDNGTGISEENLEKIFQEFQQLDNPERDRRKGLGLGLAIVRRLCEIIESRIRVFSTLKHGSVFSFALPIGKKEKVEKIETSYQYVVNRYADFSGVQVLVIDDEKDVREAIVQTLRSWGCLTIDLEDVTQQEMNQIQGIELVVSDYRLRNGRTGVDVIEDVRNYLGKTTPGILITGDTAPDRIRQASISGNMLLHKPVNPAQLRMAINQALSAMDNAN